MLQKNLDVSYRTNRWLHSFRCNTGPIESVDQHRELRRGQINNAIMDRRPGEPTFLQPLRHQHHAAAIPRQQLHSVRALRAENKHIAPVWIASKHLAHQCRQGVDRLPEIYWLGRYPDLELGATRDHRPRPPPLGSEPRTPRPRYGYGICP